MTSTTTSTTSIQTATLHRDNMKHTGVAGLMKSMSSVGGFFFLDGGRVLHGECPSALAPVVVFFLDGGGRVLRECPSALAPVVRARVGFS